MMQWRNKVSNKCKIFILYTLNIFICRLFLVEYGYEVILLDFFSAVKISGMIDYNFTMFRAGIQKVFEVRKNQNRKLAAVSFNNENGDAVHC